STSEQLASRGDSRSQRPTNEAFRRFIASGWDETVPDAERREAADHTPARRDALVRRLPATRLVLPAGVLKVRSNDTDYPFRPDTAFAYYTGLGTDEEPDSVLVVEPSAEDPERAEATYFFKPRAGFDSSEFFADSRYGEMWVGRRPTLEEASQRLGISVRHIDDLRDHLAKDVGANLSLSVMPGVDAGVEAMVAEIREQNGLPGGEEAAEQFARLTEADSEQRLVKDVQASAQIPLEATVLRRRGETAEHVGRLKEAASEQRRVKDEHEIAQMREAVAATIRGFEDVVRHLPEAVAHARGERVIEGVFARTARADGNGVGYDTIAAAGDHACTLHWIRNDGKVRTEDLVLIDAGVEVDSLYTADITRTLPVSGTFSPAQRKVYEAVL